MRELKNILLIGGLLTVSSFTIAVARPCACGEPETPVNQGGIAYAADYRGAPFTWERWVKPVVHITMNGTSTTVTVENSNSNEGMVAGISKFKFTKDLYTWTSKNKISLDVAELQKVLVVEGLLSSNSQTGIYDVTTRSAVEAFQKKYKIKPAANYPYGYFGPVTRAFQNAR